MHPLLARQLRRHGLEPAGLSRELEALLADVAAAYSAADEDRRLLERSLDLTSSELLRANAEVRATLDAFPDLILRVGPSGRVLEARGRMNGLTLGGRHAGRPLEAVLPGGLAAQLFPLIATAIEERRAGVLPSQAIEVGERPYYEARVVPVADRPEALVILRDVTELQRAHERLRRSQESLRHAQKMEAVGRLAGGIAHDFNNLLTIVLGYASLLLAEEGLPDALREPLAVIHDAGERGSRLTRQLLAFSRREPSGPASVCPSPHLKGMQEMLRRLLGSRIGLQTVLTPDCPHVPLGPSQFEQVVLNLVVNARDAMAGRGELRIEVAYVRCPDRDESGPPCGLADPHVRLTVADTGPGIPPEIVEHIFDPYFTTKPQDKGTGLGLATCYGIVSQAGGKILVDSAVGRGARFVVCLPEGERVEAPAPPALSDPRAVLAGRTVLVAEDESSVRTLVERALRQAGCAVQVAQDGEEALGMAQRLDGRFDLLLTDVVMPRCGGLQLAAAVRSRWPQARVLFMTGHSDEIRDLEAQRAPGDGVLVKPFLPQVLASAVARVLDPQPGPSGPR